MCLGGPELPSGPRWGRERAFHRAGRGLTPFISYFPQLKIGSKLLWPGGEREGGGSLPTAHPPPTALTLGQPPWPIAVGGQWGWSGNWTQSHGTCLTRAGLGAGARAGHKPQPAAPSKAWGGVRLGAALPSGQSPGLPLPTARWSGHTWGQALSSQQRPLPGSKFLHPLSPQLSTSLMLAPNG